LANDKPTIGLTADDLQKLVEALKAPAAPTPEQLAQKMQDEQMRREQASLVLQEMEQKRINQEACSHMRQNGSTPAVFVQDGAYMICQHCQKQVFRDQEPVLFNKLFQLTLGASTF